MFSFPAGRLGLSFLSQLRWTNTIMVFAFASFGAGAAQFVWGFWTSKAGMLVCTVVCGFCVACKGPVWSEVVMLIVGPDLFALAASYSMVTTGIGWMAGAPAAGI